MDTGKIAADLHAEVIRISRQRYGEREITPSMTEAESAVADAMLRCQTHCLDAGADHDYKRAHAWNTAWARLYDLFIAITTPPGLYR